MAQVTRRYKTHMSTLRRQASFRGGDEHTILIGWAGLLEHHVNRLEAGGLDEGNIALALDALDDALVKSWRHLDDIASSKSPNNCSPAEMEAARARYRAIVEEAPWARPAAVKPKGQWGGKR